MISTQDSGDIFSSELPLPPHFEKIEDLTNIPSDRLQKNPLVNVIGLIRDYQPPVKTKGTDFKCTLTIMDLSTQGQYDKGVQVVIFWPEDKMPRISGVCDVVLLRKFKAQMRSGYISLLANWASDIQVFPASKIPPWPVHPSSLIFRTTSSKSTPPSSVEAQYAAWLFHHIDKSSFPKVEEFQQKSANAMTVKDKYSLLKDVEAEHFYDLVGEVIRFHERDGRATLYLSDYTYHKLFYNNEWGGGEENSSARDGDEYGYTKSRKKTTNDWPGPYGKLSIQITVYDSHAAYIREHVKNKDWVVLRNVHVKMGNQGGCLEGFLRGDRDAWESKVQVQIIRKPEDAEKLDVRFKNGIRRKKQYWDKFKEQKQKLLEDAQNSGEKSKLDEKGASKPNGKKRRHEIRAAGEQKFVEIEMRVMEKLDLNSNVKCNHPDKQPIPLAKILNSTHIIRLPSGAEYSLPFENIKYRSNVRVVDFWPDKLEDFAVGRRASEFDILSEHSGDESTDGEEDMRLFRQGKGYGGEKIWEWRFALRVEDASKKASYKETMWLVVDNQAAQMLLNKDAVNLRQNGKALSALREVLFTLWGNLEEKKSEYLKREKEKAEKAVEKSTGPSSISSKSNASSTKPGDVLPPDSDDEGSLDGQTTRNSLRVDLEERDSNIGPRNSTELSESLPFLPVTNKGFTCCIQQYGIKVPEDSRPRADAGEGKRWKRFFRLFGTMIA